MAKKPEWTLNEYKYAAKNDTEMAYILPNGNTFDIVHEVFLEEKPRKLATGLKREEAREFLENYVKNKNK